MGLLTLTQIPCHHVLANEISLNLKYRIGLKHFFNINLGIRIIKKLLFLFVFLAYLLVFLHKFWSGELVGCIIKFHIQRVPTQHTFDGLRYPKNKKYLKKHDDDIIITFFLGISCFWGSRVRQKYAEWVLIIMFFQVFLVFEVVWSVKSMLSGYSLDVEFIFVSNELSRLKFE